MKRLKRFEWLEVSRILAVAGLIALTIESPLARADQWRSLGSRWAARIDERGTLLSIHDLSYPETIETVQLATLPLGKGSLKAALDFLKSNEEAEKPSKLKEWLAKVDGKGVRAAEKASQGWWKRLPWRDARLTRGDEPPAAFRLSDIEFDRVAEAPRKFRRGLEELVEKISELDDEPQGGGSFEFLSRFEFRRLGQGTEYGIFWSAAEGRFGFKSESGREIANLQAPRKGWERAVAGAALRTALGSLIGQIPVPFAASLLGEALGCWFKFRGQLLRQHQEMAVEALSSPGGEAVPGLSLPDTERAVKYLYFSRSDLLTVWRWLFLKPIDRWRKDLVQWEKRSDLSRDWFFAHGFEVQPLSSRFVFATDELNSRRSLYAISASRPSKTLSQPLQAIDYGRDPETERHKRQAVVAASIAGDFALGFIPVVGGILGTIYTNIVEKELSASLFWESRLRALLEERAAQGEDWERELEILDVQNVNPFEIPYSRARELAERRRRALGLEQ